VVHETLFEPDDMQFVVDVPAVAVVVAAPVVVQVAFPFMYDAQFVLETPAAPIVVHDTLFGE